MQAERRPSERETNLLASELSLLAGTERARLDMARRVLLEQRRDEPASEPLPAELPEPRPPGFEAGRPDVEPIAMHVPIECFYVRFGNFPNFLWLRHRLEDWGGEVRDLIAERGLDYNLNNRMQRQLGMRESAMAELLGDKVIADVAMIGTDTFLREGAAIGLLFHAKSNFALANDLQQQRMAAAKEDKLAKEEKLQIAGHAVSFVSTPDNSIRSFYVADGDFHLVTTSRKLVEWFLATGAGEHESLGASGDFHLARTNVPLARGDTVFAYFSPAFFHNLLDAHYQIELDRRLRSAVEIELFQIAQLAARAEHKPSDTVEELIAGDMLPAGFGERADGSRLVFVDGKPADSLRGGRGTFLPVPDVDVGQVTRRESEDFRRFARYYAQQWGPMDPVVAAVHREALADKNLERVTIDVEAAPLSPRHMQFLSQWLGEPSNQRLAPINGDIVAFEAVMRGGTNFSGGEHHLFGALRNADPAIVLDPRSGIIARALTARWDGLQGYLARGPNPAFCASSAATRARRPTPTATRGS